MAKVNVPYEGEIEDIASAFIYAVDFNEVKPTNIEMHFGAMQLSTAISMKRIADILEAVMPTESRIEEITQEAYKRGFDDGHAFQTNEVTEPDPVEDKDVS